MNTTIGKLASVALLATALVSCLKDKNVEEKRYGTDGLEDKKVIEFNVDQTNFVSTALNFVNRDTVINFATVRLAAAQPAMEDINVTLSLANSVALVDDYNAVHGTHFVQFPSSLYTSQGNGLVVTIPKGSREGYLRLKVNPSTFDPSNTYALGFRIASVDKPGYVISNNFGYFIATIGAKNAYDGIYSVVTGRVTRYTAPGSPANDALSGPLAGNPDVVLTTVGANTVEISGLQWAAGSNSGVAGINNLRATVDPATNLVTMQALGNATLTNWAGKENRYDPATKTFYLAFRWNPTANVREYEVVLRYKGPR